MLALPPAASPLALAPKGGRGGGRRRQPIPAPDRADARDALPAAAARGGGGGGEGVVGVNAAAAVAVAVAAVAQWGASSSSSSSVPPSPSTVAPLVGVNAARGEIVCPILLLLLLPPPSLFIKNCVVVVVRFVSVLIWFGLSSTHTSPLHLITMHTLPYIPGSA